MSLSPPSGPQLPGDYELVRREHARKIIELQQLPSTATRILNDRELASGVTTLIPHGLGRAPKIVLVSPPRGASSTGRIEEVRTAVDRTKYIALVATGWGATITVDVEVK